VCVGGMSVCVSVCVRVSVCACVSECVCAWMHVSAYKNMITCGCVTHDQVCVCRHACMIGVWWCLHCVCVEV